MAPCLRSGVYPCPLSASRESTAGEGTHRSTRRIVYSGSVQRHDLRSLEMKQRNGGRSESLPAWESQSTLTSSSRATRAKQEPSASASPRADPRVCCSTHINVLLALNAQNSVDIHVLQPCRAPVRAFSPACRLDRHGRLGGGRQLVREGGIEKVARELVLCLLGVCSEVERERHGEPRGCRV